MHIPSILTRRQSICGLSVAAILYVSAGSVLATDGTWTRTNLSATYWNDSSNWAGGQIADGVGSVANFTATQGGTTRAVNIEGTSITVGILNLLNQHSNGTGNQSFTFSSTSGSTLTFDNGASAAQLNILSPSYNSGGTNVFSLGIFLGSSLNINNARPLAANTLTLSGAISASSTGTKTISNVSAGPATLALSGVISDGTGIVAVRQNSTTSQTTLSGANSYTGGTFIDAGILSISSNSNLGAASGGVFFNGGTLLVTASINDGGYQPITDIGAGGGTINATGFVNWYGQITGTGALHKAGTNTLSLNNASNTHSGGIFVDQGALRVKSDGAIGATSNGITLANGASLLIQDEFNAGAARTLTLTSGSGILDIRSNFGWQGAVSGSGSLTKTGTAMLTLTGTNTYTGGTTISVGTLQVTSDVNLGNASGSVTLNGGALRVTTLGGNNTGIATSRALNIVLSSTVTTDKFLNWDGVVSGTGNITKNGASTLSLNNASNNFVGDILVDAGVFRIRGGDGALGALSNGLVFADGTTFGSIDNFSAGAGRSITLTSGVVSFSSAGTSPGFGWQGVITGTGGLTKTGAGILNLSGTGNYLGATGVSAGTLLINGDFSNAIGAVSVSSGAKLGGSGTIGGAVTVSGELAPGNSIGTLSTGSLQVTSTGSLNIELGRSVGTPVSDAVNVTGSITLDGGSNLALTLYAGLDNPQIGDVFYLLNNDGADVIAGAFSSLNGVTTTLNEGSTFVWNSLEWTITYQANFGTSFTGGNDLAIMATAVPEPSAWVLAGVGMALVLTLRRRQKLSS